MCQEMLVIPVDKVEDPKRTMGKQWRAEEEEEKAQGVTAPPPKKKPHWPNLVSLI
jgi:hypothetical protein